MILNEYLRLLQYRPSQILNVLNIIEKCIQRDNKKNKNLLLVVVVKKTTFGPRSTVKSFFFFLNIFIPICITWGSVSC